MRLYTLLRSTLVLAWATSRGDATKTDKKCRLLPQDSDWPSPETWSAELPGVTSIRDENNKTGPIPDYRLRAQSIEDVQAAVRFASEHNVRISVITTGHDQIGRNDAASGLLLDLSFMRGIELHQSFDATKDGTARLDHTKASNVITPIPGVQAAVTFGPAAAGQYLNNGRNASGLFSVTGAAG